MGYTPQQVNDMDLWEFALCSEGFRRAHSTEDDLPPPDDKTFDEMVERHQQMTRH